MVKTIPTNMKNANILTVIPVAVGLKHVTDIVKPSQAKKVVKTTDGARRLLAANSNGTPFALTITISPKLFNIRISMVKVLFVRFDVLNNIEAS